MEQRNPESVRQTDKQIQKINRQRERGGWGRKGRKKERGGRRDRQTCKWERESNRQTIKDRGRYWEEQRERNERKR